MPLTLEEPAVQGAIQAVVSQFAGNYLSTQIGYLYISAVSVPVSYHGASAGAATMFGMGTLQLLGGPVTLVVGLDPKLLDLVVGGHLRATLPLAVLDRPQQNLRFRIMMQEWKRETGHLSSMTKTVLHPAYQAIIGMGNPALPLIFEQLQRDRDHWLWALHAITQEDPAHGLVDFDEAIEAWLQWGKDHGYL